MKWLALILLVVVWSFGAITLTDIPDSTVYQSLVNGNGVPGDGGRDVLVTGTVSGATTVSARVTRWSDDSVIVAWTEIQTLVGAGAYGDTLENVPKGGPYRISVKSSTAGDSVRGANVWGVGEGIAFFGQSNVMTRPTGGSQTAVTGFAVKYVGGTPYPLDDDWIHSTNNGQTSIVPSVANKVLTDTKNAYPVFVCGYAKGGSPMVTDVGYGSWHDTTSLFALLVAQIKDLKPRSIVMYQGESDILETHAAYQSAVEDVHGWLADYLGYTPELFVVQIREEGDSTYSTVIYWNIMSAHRDLDNGTTRLLAACTYDLPTYDGVHLSGPSQKTCGTRVGHTIARYLNDSLAYGYRGPHLDSASAIDRGRVRMYLHPIVGNTIISKSTARLRYKTEGNDAVDLLSSVVVGDTALDLYIRDRQMIDSAWIYYDKYRTTSNPGDSVIYDSDSLPMEPDR